MRFIQKIDKPIFFVNDTNGFKNWDEYIVSKNSLRKYILKNEQNYLCIYCETKITSDNISSHVEHIRPKAQDKYPELTFEYNNLAVSCNGTCFNQIDDRRKYNCGHIKDDEYEEGKFLNPCEVVDLEVYFQYDFDDFKISPTKKNFSKAKYMIDTLKLNSGRLVKARENTYKSFNKNMKKTRDIVERNEKIKKNINLVKIQFISLLKYKYKAIF